MGAVSALAIILSASAAEAQSGGDVVVMRRVLSAPTRGANAPSGPATQPVYGYDWQVSDWTIGQAACGGTATDTRTVVCRRSDGSDADDGSCQAPKPDAVRTHVDTSACTYAWTPSVWTTPAPACGPSTQTRTVVCMRSDGTVATDETSCAEDRPATTQDVTDHSTCLYGWAATEWVGTGTGCGNDAQTRTVTCQRSDGVDVTADNAAAGYDHCAQADAPASTQTVQQTTSCTYSATYGGPYGDCRSGTPGGSNGTRSTTLGACTRSDGVDYTSQNLADGHAECAAASTEPCTITYIPTYGVGGNCTPTTPGGTTGTVTTNIVGCKDSNGNTVSNSYCGGDKVTTCTIRSYSEKYGAYGTCNGSTQTQTANITECDVVADVGSGAVSTASCPAAKQTIATACTTVTCGGFITGTSSTIASVKFGSATDSNTAYQSCVNYANSVSTTGVCTWNSRGYADGSFAAYGLYYTAGGSQYNGQSYTMETISCRKK